MTFRRGGLADLLHEFNRLHTRRFRFAARMGDVFRWVEQCDGEFRRGRPALVYENIPSTFPGLQDRFEDLGPHLELESPFTGKPWHTSFRPEALRSMGLPAPGVRRRPSGAGHRTSHIGRAYALVIDYSAPAINYNMDVLEGLGVRLPIRTWAEFEDALDRCARADFTWPIALFNAPPTEGLSYFARGIQEQVMQGLFEALDADGDGNLSGADWLEAIERGKFHERIEPYVESLRILKRLSRYFLWYANRYDSLHVKPFYFSRRPQSLFRVGDFRRVRADMELYATVVNGRRLFPFREGAMHLPEITRETSPFASGPYPLVVRPSLFFSVARAGHSRAEVETAVGLLRFLTTPESQAFFTRWSFTLSAVRDVPPPPIYEGQSVVFRLARVSYVGVTEEGAKIWSAAARQFIEPEGRLKDMLRATRRAIETDRVALPKLKRPARSSGRSRAQARTAASAAR